MLRASWTSAGVTSSASVDEDEEELLLLFFFLSFLSFFPVLLLVPVLLRLPSFLDDFSFLGSFFVLFPMRVTSKRGGKSVAEGDMKSWNLKHCENKYMHSAQVIGEWMQTHDIFTCTKVTLVQWLIQDIISSLVFFILHPIQVVQDSCLKSSLFLWFCFSCSAVRYWLELFDWWPKKHLPLRIETTPGGNYLIFLGCIYSSILVIHF